MNLRIVTAIAAIAYAATSLGAEVGAEVEAHFCPPGSSPRITETARACLDADGELHGPMEIRSDDGVLLTRGTYVHGKEDGLHEGWSPNGTKIHEARFVRGKQHGAFRSWSDDGALKEEVTYEHGVRHGRQVIYVRDGKPLWTRHYDKGRLLKEALAVKAPERGGLPKEILGLIITRNASQAQFCYERQLQYAPNLEGGVSTEFTIDTDGRVSKATAKEIAAGMEDVARCIVERVKTWEFPRPFGGGPVTITYPYLFQKRPTEER